MSLNLALYGVPLASNSINFLLNETQGVASAYSTTSQLSKTATKAIRIVRAGDLVETDIGFTSTGTVDHDAAIAFLGGDAGTVKVIYDQSGVNDLSQSVVAQQPAYSVNGAVFDGDDDEIVSAQPFYGLPYSIFSKLSFISYDGTQNAGLNNLFNSSEGDNLIFRAYSATMAQVYAGDYITQVYPLVLGELFQASIFVESGNSSCYKDGVLVESGTALLAPAQGLQIGSRPGAIRYANVLFDTFVVYSGNQSANRAKIEGYL